MALYRYAKLRKKLPSNDEQSLSEGDIVQVRPILEGAYYEVVTINSDTHIRLHSRELYDYLQLLQQ